MKKILIVLIALVSVLGLSVANAALPAVIGTSLTQIQTDATDIVALLWPVVAAVTGMFIVFKLFKRGSSKI